MYISLNHKLQNPKSYYYLTTLANLLAFYNQIKIYFQIEMQFPYEITKPKFESIIYIIVNQM